MAIDTQTPISAVTVNGTSVPLAGASQTHTLSSGRLNAIDFTNWLFTEFLPLGLTSDKVKAMQFKIYANNSDTQPSTTTGTQRTIEVALDGTITSSYQTGITFISTSDNASLDTDAPVNTVHQMNFGITRLTSSEISFVCTTSVISAYDGLEETCCYLLVDAVPMSDWQEDSGLFNVVFKRCRRLSGSATNRHIQSDKNSAKIIDVMDELENIQAVTAEFDITITYID